jgi:hypothetical protein
MSIQTGEAAQGRKWKNISTKRKRAYRLGLSPQRTQRLLSFYLSMFSVSSVVKARVGFNLGVTRSAGRVGGGRPGRSKMGLATHLAFGMLHVTHAEHRWKQKATAVTNSFGNSVHECIHVNGFVNTGLIQFKLMAP